MPSASTRAGRIWYEIDGDGPPAVFITGLAGYASYWRPQIGLVKHRRVLTYDHIGIGRSDRPFSPYSVEGMAGDLIALMDELGLEKVDLVGHSTGGCIAQVAAAEFPERVGRLILASSWLSADWRFERLFRLRQATLQSEGTLNYARWGAMSNYPPEWVLARRDAMEEAERQAAADSDPGILSARIDAILRFDGRLYASRIEHPATVVCARDDQVTPPHMSEALAAALPQARNVWFDTGGHCFSVVHGEAFAQFISTELAA